MKLLEDLNRCRISVKGKALSCFCLPPAGTLPVPIWSLWHCSLGQKQLTAELTFRSLRMASVSGWHNLGSDESLHETEVATTVFRILHSFHLSPFVVYLLWKLLERVVFPAVADRHRSSLLLNGVCYKRAPGLGGLERAGGPGQFHSTC